MNQHEFTLFEENLYDHSSMTEFNLRLVYHLHNDLLQFILYGIELSLICLLTSSLCLKH